MATILLIDDEKRVRDGIKLSLSGLDYDISEADAPEAGFAIISSVQPELILLDVHFRNDVTCLPLMEKLQKVFTDIPVLILSGAASAKEAADAMKLGAYDFLEKPISADRLRLSVQNALEAAKAKAKSKSATTERNIRADILGNSPSIEKVRDLISQFSRRDAKVLLTGETGTGKELVAHGIWQSSPRSNKPFILINTAAIPDSLIESELFGHMRGAFAGANSSQVGKIEMADGGTALIDEVGELSLIAQSKLLRFIETGEIQPVGSVRTKKCDIRLIVATSRDLQKEIKAGRFREDLYFRLNVARIEIEPLRRRKEDIIEIFTHFIETICKRYDEPKRILGSTAQVALLEHRWPGNVRELRNVAERAVLLSQSEITKELLEELLGTGDGPKILDPELPRNIEEAKSLKEYRKDAERKYVAHVLGLAKGSVTKTAQVLDIDRSHLHQKLKDLGIQNSQA